MIDTLIHWSLRNRAAVLAGAALLLVIGGYTAIQMPVDVFAGPYRADGDSHHRGTGHGPQ